MNIHDPSDEKQSEPQRDSSGRHQQSNRIRFRDQEKNLNENNKRNLTGKFCIKISIFVRWVSQRSKKLHHHCYNSDEVSSKPLYNELMLVYNQVLYMSPQTTAELQVEMCSLTTVFSVEALYRYLREAVDPGEDLEVKNIRNFDRH